MAIFKANIKEQYVVIPNETAQNSSLTFEARGLLALMLSLPVDWEIHKSWLIEQAPNCGRDKLNRIIAELVEAGYMKKHQERNSTGEFKRNDYYVYPVAGDWKPVNGLSVDGEPPTTKETDNKVNNDKDLSKRTVCPYGEIQKLYNECLPRLTGCRRMDEKTKKQIKKIWNSDYQHQSLDFWRMYFSSLNQLNDRMPNWSGELDGKKHGTIELLTRDNIFARNVNELLDKGIWQ